MLPPCSRRTLRRDTDSDPLRPRLSILSGTMCDHGAAPQPAAPPAYCHLSHCICLNQGMENCSLLMHHLCWIFQYFQFLNDFGGIMAIWTRNFWDALYVQFVLGNYQSERSRWVLPRVRQGGNILLWILWCCSAAGPGLCLDQHQSAQSQSWPLVKEYHDFLIHVSARNKQE